VRNEPADGRRRAAQRHLVEEEEERLVERQHESRDGRQPREKLTGCDVGGSQRRMLHGARSVLGAVALNLRPL